MQIHIYNYQNEICNHHSVTFETILPRLLEGLVHKKIINFSIEINYMFFPILIHEFILILSQQTNQLGIIEL